jgi:[ribosomal protein S5]-alanine N-acetyltransferase
MRVPLDTCLETPRCVLRCVGEDDIEHVWTATRHPGFNDGMPWNPPTSKAQIYGAIRHHLNMWASGEEYVWTIRARADKDFIGRVSIRPVLGDGVWSIGFWIHPLHWRQGFATEASRTLIEFGFTRLDVTKIVADHALWNIASRRVMGKLGLRYLRDNPRGFEKNGRWVAEAQHELDRDSWLAAVGKP